MSAMEDTQSVATLIDSTTSKIQQLQKAFAELESHRAVTLNLKWKQLEEHFHGLEKSLKRRFYELEDQEKEYGSRTVKAQEVLVKREADVIAKEEASLEKLQQKRDAAVCDIFSVKHKPEEKIYEEEKPPDFTVSESIETVEVKSHPELVKLCNEMDSNGLHKFISDNRKNLATIKDEIPIAFKSAANPASLVLDSLKGFYEGSCSDSKKDSTLLGLRRSCIMLMECLSILVMNLDYNTVSSLISQEAKEKAKIVAEAWKPMLDDLDLDDSNGNSLEAHAFLQLVATFGINSDFDLEDLSKLIPMVSRRRQTAELCRSLGLSEKMPGVISVLINNGRQIDAVNLAFAFELTEQFSPVSLLKSYLDDAKKVSSPLNAGNSSPSTVLNEVNTDREMTALKAVIRCIEDHRLCDEYPIEPLQKQILDIEKVKADKKRATEVGKPQTKRPRANGPARSPATAAAEKNVYARTTDRYPQYVYDRQYHVPVAAYGIPATAHANYFATGFQYQAPYLH